MGRKAIDKEKTGRQILRDRVVASRDTVKHAREDLRQRVDAIRLNCENAPAIAIDRLRARFLEIGQKLQATLDPETQLLDERFKKRAVNAAKATCRLDARNARIEVEPVIRAGKAAQKAHRETQKLDQQLRKQERQRRKEENAKVPRTAKMQEVEQQIVRELQSDPATAALVPIWNRVRVRMYKKAKESGGLLSPLEAFVHYVEENENEINHLLADIHKQADKKLAREQGGAREAEVARGGEAVPSSAFHVPSSRAAPPASSTRARSQPGSKTTISGPTRSVRAV